MISRGYSSADSLFIADGRPRVSAEEENERRLVAFSRSRHLVEGVSWCGEGSMGHHLGHHWSSLTET